MKVKKSTKEKGFKWLISRFWFWIIVAVVSYFIFISIPITWNESGFGWDAWEGGNPYKKFFAYLTQIAWITAIVLLIINAIKWIQKTKIGDYWKISFTILGVIGIIAYVYFSLAGLGIFDNFTSDYDNRIGETDKDKIKLIKIHIEMLEEDGYEVLYFYYSLPNTTLESAYIKMSSLGNQNNQVWDGLHSLTAVYPNAPKYEIVILEPTQSCWYVINGTIYGTYRRALKETNFTEALENIEEYRESAVFILGQYVNYQIENPTCS